MIAIHLLPFPFRGARAPYLWIFHAALEKLGSNAVYILSADYLSAEGNASKLSPTASRSLAQASYALISDKEMRAFADRYPSRELAWQDYLTAEIPQLIEIYERALDRLPGIEAVRALVNWCNCPSLVKACQGRKIRVIHQEAGSLRQPSYLPTIYFDASGVNGNTEAEKRYLKLNSERQQLPIFPRRELLNIFSAAELDREVRFKRGVALQVEDDSNIIAYANGFNSAALINLAMEDVSPAEVLVRDHPLAHFTYIQRSASEPARDESAATGEFLCKIEHLYTINSSLGAEALLHGIPVTCLGDTPYKFIAAESVDSAEFAKKLSFYCLNYLVPAEFLLDQEYLCWRLGSPSELEIQEKHLSAYATRSIPPVFFAQLYFDTGNGYNEENSIKRPIKLGRQRLVFSGFPHDATIHALRLDPLNDHAVVRIENLGLLGAGDTAIATSIASCNADYSDESELFFTHGDPSTFIEIPGGRIAGLNQISVDLEVKACGQAQVKSLLGSRSIDALIRLQQVIAQRDQAATERDRLAADRHMFLLDRDRVVIDLQQVIAERDEALSERDRIAAQLREMTAQRDQAAVQCEQTAADRQVISLDRDRLLADLQQTLAHRDEVAADRDRIVADREIVQRDRECLAADLNQTTAQRDHAFNERDRACAERDYLATSVHLLKRTVSWRITSPLRWLSSRLGGPSLPYAYGPVGMEPAESLNDGQAYTTAEPSAAMGSGSGMEKAAGDLQPNQDTGPLWAQLFVDVGDGYNEESSLRRPVLVGKQQLVFKALSQESIVQSLRIDPVNDHAVVRLDRVLLTDAVGRHALGTVIALNAAHTDATGCWFTHDDPQFLVQVPEDMQSRLEEVAIDMELLIVGRAEVAEALHACKFQGLEWDETSVDQAGDGYLEAFEVLSGGEAALPCINIERDAAKLIAFYLPQYHRIQENSEWWGPGFTEWTNVVKGKPNFEGHLQPHLPRELGFYDLSSVEVMREQAEMAKLYGVHAFCFYYYWFSGRRVLEKPLEQFLKSDIDFNYCLCWANENWTRTWDGDTRSVLMEQKYAESDPEEFIKSLLPYFRDQRYIRVDGKPMLVVYRAKDIPDVKAVFAFWKRAVESAGFLGLHITVVDFYDISRPEEVDADALAEFPPHKFNGAGSNPDVAPAITNSDFQGSLVDYAKVIQQSLGRNKPDYPLYRAAMPSWDNTARRQNTPTILYGASPVLFQEWLNYLRAYTREHSNGKEDNFIFVNAWNEWGEGCHLEPDWAWGLGNLEAVAKSAWFDPADALGAVREQTLRAAKRSIGLRHSGSREP